MLNEEDELEELPEEDADIAALEAKFKQSHDQAYKETRAVRDAFYEARAIAHKKIEEVAEKYGVPLEFNGGKYLPKSFDTIFGVDGEVSEEMQEFVGDWYGYYGDCEPGEWWEQSYC